MLTGQIRINHLLVIMVRILRISLGMLMTTVGIIQIFSITDRLVLSEALLFSTGGLIIIANELASSGGKEP